MPTGDAPEKKHTGVYPTGRKESSEGALGLGTAILHNQSKTQRQLSSFDLIGGKKTSVRNFTEVVEEEKSNGAISEEGRI